MADSTLDNLPVLTGPAMDQAADLVLVLDVSANVDKQVTVSSFFAACSGAALYLYSTCGGL